MVFLIFFYFFFINNLTRARFVHRANSNENISFVTDIVGEPRRRRDLCAYECYRATVVEYHPHGVRRRIRNTITSDRLPNTIILLSLLSLLLLRVCVTIHA